METVSENKQGCQHDNTQFHTQVMWSAVTEREPSPKIETVLEKPNLSLRLFMTEM